MQATGTIVIITYNSPVVAPEPLTPAECAIVGEYLIKKIYNLSLDHGSF